MTIVSRMYLLGECDWTLDPLYAIDPVLLWHGFFAEHIKTEYYVGDQVPI